MTVEQTDCEYLGVVLRTCGQERPICTVLVCVNPGQNASLSFPGQKKADTYNLLLSS